MDNFSKRNIFRIQNQFLLIILFMGSLGHAQYKVSASIDRDSIKIGEQIKYSLTVETDTLSTVIFPEDQTFSPVEMVEALKIDTLKEKDRLLLKRMYALTQFDSGAYTVPKQLVAINEQQFYTDSFSIKVSDVVVDTTKQKLYDIKPLINVERNYAKVWNVLAWLIPVLCLILAAIWWFFIRQKPVTEEEKIKLLPPFERAMLKLEELEKSKYLIQEEYKAYYTELTDIVRNYLEEEVNIRAQESTTDQLMAQLEMRIDAGELKLNSESLEQFREILSLADLVKFAKTKPETSVAENNRKMVIGLVEKTKEAIPVLEEVKQEEDPEYETKLKRKKLKKKVVMAAASFLGFVVGYLAVSIAFRGFTDVKDSLLRNESKLLLEGEWVQSNYGYPAIEIHTPEVLLREIVPDEELKKDSLQSAHVFGYTSHHKKLKISLVSQLFLEAKNPDFEKFSENFLRALETNGGVNIIAKTEETFTKSGKQGAKVFGSYKIPLYDGGIPERFKYELWIFGGQGFTQHIFLSWDASDEYLNQIIEGIKASIDVNTEG